MRAGFSILRNPHIFDFAGSLRRICSRGKKVPNFCQSNGLRELYFLIGSSVRIEYLVAALHVPRLMVMSGFLA